jgi:hypothetical protein
MKVNNWTLVDDLMQAPVVIGQTIEDFRGRAATLLGGTPPAKLGSTGRVETSIGEFYPSVFGLMWVNNGQPEGEYEEDAEDPNDYVGMGWVGRDGRP